MRNIFISGGAGFIGSNMASFLVKKKHIQTIKIFDNFSSGKHWFVPKSKKILVIKGDIKNIKHLIKSIKGSDTVFHFAANPDISAAIKNPDIDFVEGTLLLRNILEAMRINNIKKIIFSSGSGVYGDIGKSYAIEDKSVPNPISTYGASKLYCDSLISAYCHLLDFTGVSFRFANVIGPNMTHGVCYDFVKNLFKNKKKIVILGNGNQSKSYLHVSDVIRGLYQISKKNLKKYLIFNMSTKDYITVKQILNTVLKKMKITKIDKIYTGGKRGWKGDVPIVRINSDKIRKIGWKNKFTSKTSVIDAVGFLINNAKQYRFINK
jgi:UDP-glucose 4-epimerase